MKNWRIGSLAARARAPRTLLTEPTILKLLMKNDDALPCKEPSGSPRRTANRK